MNTKNKIIAILMASVIAMAIAVPMAMGDDPQVDSTATLKNSPPEIICKCEDPDDRPNIPGTQITPNPLTSTGLDQLKTVTICARVCDPNGKDDISSVVAEVFYPNITKKCDVTLDVDTCPCTLYKPEITQTQTACTDDPTLCQLYKGTFQMSSRDPAGEYRVKAIAHDAAGENDTLQNRFFYESIVVIHLNFSEVNWGNIEVCKEAYVVPGTIHNLGNDNATITINASDLKNNGDIISAVNLDATIEGENYWDLSIPQTYSTLFEQCVPHEVNFSIHAPFGTPPGTYTGKINIEGAEAGTRKILLENKNPSDIYQYDPILGDGIKGDLTYDVQTLDYTFNGHGLDTNTEYCLIYYSEPWATQGAGKLLNSGNTNATGDIQLTSTLPPGLPVYSVTGDYKYDLAGGKYAKIWLVPCSDYDKSSQKMKTGVWNPSKILFEIETIMT